LTPSSWRRLALILKPLFFLKPMLLGLALSLASLSIQAGPREQAKQMHDRLTGVPPSEEVLNQMAEEIRLGNALAAADIAMENPAFYTATLKRMAAPWTNRDQNPFVALNDYIATFIGLVRDEADFRRILYDDVLYIGNPALTDNDYSPSNNLHYQEIEQRGLDLSDPNVLVPASQSDLNGGIPAAGVKPMVVSMLLPSRTAARLTPFPRCARMIRPRAASGPAMRASSAMPNSYERPWNP